ncbi:MAG: FkbM family methyltransferase [Chitinophagaceae bacterium]
MSTGLKLRYLRLLRQLGKRSLVAKSVFGLPYRISLGDGFSENPFYNPYSNTGEIIATAAWVTGRPKPVVFDIGGHCGFIASQLAGILKQDQPAIYSIEPVAPTFADLVETVQVLSLQQSVFPVPVALNDQPGFVRLNYSKRNSMLAQIIPDEGASNQRSGTETYLAPAQTLDQLCATTGVPDVIKIDVEGWEVHVLQGGPGLLGSDAFINTGICLEWNPQALIDVGSSVRELYGFFRDYRFFYLNDYEGQKMPELAEIADPLAIDHVCNCFAIHQRCDRAEEWKRNYEQLKAKYRVRVG